LVSVKLWYGAQANWKAGSNRAGIRVNSKALDLVDRDPGPIRYSAQHGGSLFSPERKRGAEESNWSRAHNAQHDFRRFTARQSGIITSLRFDR
jgi:hypothetical protein